MEFQEIAITSTQNTPQNGYGKNRVQPNLPDVFAKFYGLEYFPSLDESGGKDFNGPVYSKRIKVKLSSHLALALSINMVFLEKNEIYNFIIINFVKVISIVPSNNEGSWCTLNVKVFV